VTCDGTFSRAFLARRQCTTSRGANMTRAPRRNTAPKKRCAVCAVCGMEKRDYRKFRRRWVDKRMKVALRMDPSHFRYPIISERAREGAFERLVTADDVICNDCHNHHSSNAGVARMTPSERAAEQAVWDAIRIDLLLKFMDNDCGGQFPPWCVKYTLPGWNGPGLIHARQWIRALIRCCRLPGSPTRLEAVAALGHKEAALVADLLSREKQYHGNCDVKDDSRRVRILAKYVRKNGLPTCRASAALADWEHEGADVAQVKVGKWWSRFSRHNGGERKKRVETLARLARDEETQKALRDLAQCKVQDHGNCDVEGDSRRVRILAKYVREELDGQLPRDKDVAALAGWAHEDAVVAQVKVAIWWRNFSRHNGGERKKRVEESAPDEETQDALQYLAQCPMRKLKRFKGQRN